MTSKEKAATDPVDEEQAPKEPSAEEQELIEQAEAARAEHDELVAKLVAVLDLTEDQAERLACALDPPLVVPGELALAEPVPAIGRIVHYHTHVRTYPAIIVAAYERSEQQACDLAVFGSPLGTFASRLGVLRGAPGRNNTWSWPPLLPALEEADED